MILFLGIPAEFRSMH